MLSFEWKLWVCTEYCEFYLNLHDDMMELKLCLVLFINDFNFPWYSNLQDREQNKNANLFNKRPHTLLGDVSIGEYQPVQNWHLFNYHWKSLVYYHSTNFFYL